MNLGQTVFSQLLQHLPHKQFQKCVARYAGDSYVKSLSCWDQFLAMVFAQLTYRESLRDIEACLRSIGGKRYHMRFRSTIARSTLADANESRDWRIYADFAQTLIAIARPLYAHDPIGVELQESLYALDSTTIDLCISLFPWAKFRQHKAAVKVHTLLDLHGNIPSFIRITAGKTSDVNILDEFLPEAGAFYVLDRGYTCPPRRGGNRRLRVCTRRASRPAWLFQRQDCANSSPAVQDKNSGSNTDSSPGRASKRTNRRSRANCWAAARGPCRHARYTSRGARPLLTIWNPGTICAGQKCDSPRNRG
jgi:Domain of unknown function (DUF4372)/Transposase DDE domain